MRRLFQVIILFILIIVLIGIFSGNTGKETEMGATVPTTEDQIIQDASSGDEMNATDEAGSDDPVGITAFDLERLLTEMNALESPDIGGLGE